MKISGNCPMGCGETLEAVIDEVLCTHPDCPDPHALAQILAQPVGHHLARFDNHNFAIQHPLSERVGGIVALAECELVDRLGNLSGQPVDEPGYYKVSDDGDGWYQFERIEV